MRMLKVALFTEGGARPRPLLKDTHDGARGSNAVAA